MTMPLEDESDCLFVDHTASLTFRFEHWTRLFMYCAVQCYHVIETLLLSYSVLTKTLLL